MAKFRKVYEEFEKPGINFDPKEGRTKQSFKDECDINNIVKRYETLGQLPDLIKADPRYGDFSSVPDYQTSIMIVQKAQEQFDVLPSRVRERFANDPERFLAFAQDPKNAREMVSMGLAIEQKAEAKTAASVTPSPATTTKKVEGA